MRRWMAVVPPLPLSSLIMNTQHLTHNQYCDVGTEKCEEKKKAIATTTRTMIFVTASESLANNSERQTENSSMQC